MQPMGKPSRILNPQRLACVRDDGLLTSNRSHVRDGAVHDLLVIQRFAHAHIQRDLTESRTRMTDENLNSSINPETTFSR